jgi:hypothetical protein
MTKSKGLYAGSWVPKYLLRLSAGRLVHHSLLERLRARLSDEDDVFSCVGDGSDLCGTLNCTETFVWISVIEKKKKIKQYT